MEEEIKYSPISEEEEIKDFLQFRKIEKEDIPLIENLSRYPKLLNEFHNFFNLLKEKSLDDLKRQIKNLEEEETERKDFLSNLIKFAEKYDWATCFNLIRILERRSHEKNS